MKIRLDNMETSTTQPITQPATIERKNAEEILREEIRALRDVALRLCEWGITLLVSIETALWFVRQDVRSNMISAKTLDSTAPLPWGIYLFGTFFLFMVSGIFIMLMMNISGTSRGYRKQLAKCIESGIYEPPIRKTSRRSLVFMFLLIPLVDFGFRAIVPSLLVQVANKAPTPAMQRTGSAVTPAVSIAAPHSPAEPGSGHASSAGS